MDQSDACITQIQHPLIHQHAIMKVDELMFLSIYGVYCIVKIILVEKYPWPEIPRS